MKASKVYDDLEPISGSRTEDASVLDNNMRRMNNKRRGAMILLYVIITSIVKNNDYDDECNMVKVVLIVVQSYFNTVAFIPNSMHIGLYSEDNIHSGNEI